MGQCAWALATEMDRIYHDTEWGIPVHDDRQMFEHLTLECLQCGLSWGLMLKKREIFRECFANFNFGFKYVGPVNIYSHLQACGIINDHGGDCPCFAKINAANPTTKMKPEHEVGHA